MALGSPDVFWVVSGLTGLLDDALPRRPAKQIPLTEVQTFLSQLNDAGYFPESISVDQITTSLQFFFGRLLAATGAVPSSIDALHMGEMHNFLARWLTLEQAMENL